ncbi:MAG: hypothetical protein UHG68_02605 [Clostridia bacterium]|nr:hypothetical protein [Clostridia bacterium]
MRDIFSFVKQEDECVLYSYTNTAKRLKKEGAAQFLLPGSAAGLFLVLLGILLPHLFSASTGSVFFGALSFFGGMILFSSLIIYAMFLRSARQAEGYSLYITTQNLILCESGRYARMPLCDIESARVERASVFKALPFDMSALEREYIVIFYRGADMKIPFIDGAEHASKKITELCNERFV